MSHSMKVFRLLLISAAAGWFMAACSSVPEAPPVPETEPAAVASTSSQAPESAEGIEFAEPPAVPEAEVQVASEEPICRLERKTGTNRKVRVCRPRANAAQMNEAQRTFDSLRRSQTGASLSDQPNTSTRPRH